MKEELSYGSVNISKEVISVIAGVAAQEVDSVAQVGDSVPPFMKLVSGIPIGRGIKVEIVEKDVFITIPVYIKQDRFFPDLVRDVQQHVKEVVESMTGLSVREVNVIIRGVSISDKGEKEEVK